MIATGTPEEVAAEPALLHRAVPGRAAVASRAQAADGAGRRRKPGARPPRANGSSQVRTADGPQRPARSDAPRERDELSHARALAAAAVRAELKLWAQKWRWYERNSLPWNRARIHWEFMRRDAFVRWPVHGNVLEALREGRLEIGAQRAARARRVDHGARRRAGADRRRHVPEPRRDGRGAGAGGDRRPLHARQRLLRHRRRPPLRRPDARSPWQGFESKGPTRIGDNCWCGANVVVTSGVTIGERCVIGANCVVTRDIPPFSIAAGAPARVIKQVTYAPGLTAADQRRPTAQRPVRGARPALLLREVQAPDRRPRLWSACPASP